MDSKLLLRARQFVIENGELVESNMRKLRLTADKLEMRLRQAGISNFSDVEWATIEVSGNLGYELKLEKQPATKEDIQRLIDILEKRIPHSERLAPNNIFSEIKYGHQNPPPTNLQ
ncbi:YetF domain-containing protein [Brevibacillus brevis]|uniref:YetF domain-containing protein n=1 Tax=Brevibacillus brevis TaxID=1393 RepID=UPI000A773710